MTQSEQFLMEAFAGASQANRRYLAFAQQAEKEGYPQVAKLFRAAAEAETVHAHAHLRALKGVKSTVENLKEAISGETHEFNIMYPAMIGTAIVEGHKEAEHPSNMPIKWERSTLTSLRKPWRILTSRQRWIIASAPCAAIPGKSSHRKSANCVALRPSNFSRLVRPPERQEIIAWEFAENQI
jgi:rubrerythrin